MSAVVRDLARAQAAAAEASVVKQPLDDVEAFLQRFVSYPSPDARVAHVLWIAHTHLMDHWESTPRIAFLSPEPGSGKSRALEVSELLVPLPVQAVNVTPAYLFRKVGAEEGRPTVLYDEIDTVFGARAKENEEIRGLLNAGHRRSGVAGRCVVRGKQVFTEEIPAYCAVALAGLGGLPDTILSRCVIVKMRRRAPSEPVEPFRRRVHEPAGSVLRKRLEDWAGTVKSQIGDPWPEMPAGIADRDADIWEPLLSMAAAAGGAWLTRARDAAKTLVKDAQQNTPSLGVRLLGDLRHVFGNRNEMFTERIIDGLCGIDESPWADLRGKPIDARGLASRLRGYGIESQNLRIDGVQAKGYTRADLRDAWSRYLQTPAVGTPPMESVPSVPSVPSAPGEWADGTAGTAGTLAMGGVPTPGGTAPAGDDGIERGVL